MEVEPDKPANMPVGGLLSEYLACSDAPPDHLNDVSLYTQLSHNERLQIRLNQISATHIVSSVD